MRTNRLKSNYCRQFVLFVLAILASALASAQAARHGGQHQVADVTGIAAKTETSPADNTVLEQAPGQIDLLFPVDVRLVKLVLRNEQRDWVDIDFRYNPRSGQNFQWQLPLLRQAVYYTVDWAVLDHTERLVKGNFSFAFGADAKAPSITRAAEEALLQRRYGDPSIRYVAPPRTQIIIDRDPPRYDPPFTIDLDEENPDNDPDD